MIVRAISPTSATLAKIPKRSELDLRVVERGFLKLELEDLIE